jgi:hypothetical protein
VIDTATHKKIARFKGRQVVLDTQGPLLYIGTLTEVGRGFLLLSEADVHDRNDSPATKDLYLVETRELGVRVNRERVLVVWEQVASVSLLEDVRM